MALKIYNTLTRKIEVFKPLEDKSVRFYNCGPTVYNFAHIGNFRSYVSQDVFRRYLKFRGFKLKQVTNLTDVDDKTIKGSQKEGISLKEFTRRYEKAFFEDVETLNIEKSDVYPRATEHINEMVSMIKTLLENGHAYKAQDGSIYYDISKFPDYGKLSHTNMMGLKAGARVKQDEYTKENAQDFALWKAWDKEDGDVFWETEIGKGRPGWHIECSAMSRKYLGDTFDVHAGGVDLIFPHHENEIAQSEGTTGKKFVNYWLHTEHLLVDGKKMSKSLGNFYTLRDVLGKGYSPRAIRYLLLSVHYRQQLNFTFESLKAANEAVEKFDNFVFALKNVIGTNDNKKVGELINNAQKSFEDSMDSDLDISPALAAVFEFMKDVNILVSENKLSKKDAEACIAFIKKIDSVLGILKKDEEEVTPEIKELIEQREFFRKKKDWKKSDEIREKLAKLGIQLWDTPDGPKWKRI